MKCAQVPPVTSRVLSRPCRRVEVARDGRLGPAFCWTDRFLIRRETNVAVIILYINPHMAKSYVYTRHPRTELSVYSTDRSAQLLIIMELK